MLQVRLDDDDIVALTSVVEELARLHDTVESNDFVRQSRVFADELPRALRARLNDFRLREPAATLVVSGWPVDDEALGSTPDDPAHKPVPSPSIEHDLAFFLIASLLGDPIGWATQQDGHLMHDVFPTRAHEHGQIGWGSAELLTWHTEDAFHPLRTDYLGLLCLRNPDGVETTVADVADLTLDEATVRALREEQFLLLPDDSHRGCPGAPGPGDTGRVAELARRGWQRVERALTAPEPVAVLFGDPDDPYLRLDPHYMAPPPPGLARQALEEICAAVDAAMGGVVLAPGDMCFIDNYRAVHGRKPFQARFDGTDRWLRRLNVTRDLRRSRAARASAESRVIY